MNTKQLIAAGLVTTALLGLAVPAQARPDDKRDNGQRQQSQSRQDNPRAQRGYTPRPGSWEARHPVQTPAPAPALPQQYRATASTQPNTVRTPTRTSPRVQSGYTPRPGSWEARTNAQPRQNWAGDQDRSNDRARDQDRNRDQNQARDRDRSRDQSRDRDRSGDRTWTRDRDQVQSRDRDRDVRRQDWADRSDRRDWRYTPHPVIRDRWQGYRPWNDRWRAERRYDWQYYRRLHRDRYRLPRYYAPDGWNRGYFRFWAGVYINNILFGMNYWIDDPYYYRLPPAYGHLRWIRYYDDALLVDIRDGYVVDVVYNVFW